MSVKERPILFSGPMIRALLAGAKTQTRRVVKMPRGFDFIGGLGDDINSPANWGGEDEEGRWWALAMGDGIDHVLPCPYGQPGDRLWVRETWYCDDYRVQRGPYIKPDDLDVTEARDDGTLVYAADGLTPYEAEQPVWRPSIHMPRWASRIDLEVTGVRVERLQDISDDDAHAEGVEWNKCPTKPDPEYLKRFEMAQRMGMATHYSALIDYVGGFRALWESINGPGSWDANPWVWVVEFKRVKP